MASTFGAAFDALDHEVQRSMFKQLQHRRKRYTRAMKGETLHTEVILLGDTPGPGRPNDPNYHHTPFYSTKNSSLWINHQLVKFGVPETSLLWFNTTLADGTSLDAEIVKRQLKPGVQVFCLGSRAEKWWKETGLDAPCQTVYHPQAWKRFKSKEPYPLMGLLQHALDL